MFKGVIFDMDGVLVDNRDIHVAAFAHWCEGRGIYFPTDALLELFGMGNDDIMKIVLKNPNLSNEEIELYAHEKETIYRDMIADSIKPLDGLVPLLKSLKEAGIKIAVGSSGMRQNVDFVLKSCNIASYFDAIADGDQISHAKPDPEVFLLAAHLLDLRPEDCLVMEDSFAGIEAARRAGMKVVALATTFPLDQHKEYDMLISDFRELSMADIASIAEKRGVIS